MKKCIIDYIGDAIVELMVASLYILFPIAHVCGVCSGLISKSFRK